MKTLVVDPQLCTGCMICELRCSFRKEGVFSPSHSRIKVVRFEEEGLFIPLVCAQCRKAYCAAVCPVRAIRRDKRTGALLVDEEACIGCRLCAMTCPIGVLNVKPDGGVVKCDLCAGDPYCAKYCPTGALKFIEPEKAPSKKRAKIAEEVLAPLMAARGGGLIESGR